MRHRPAGTPGGTVPERDNLAAQTLAGQVSHLLADEDGVLRIGDPGINRRQDENTYAHHPPCLLTGLGPRASPVPAMSPERASRAAKLFPFDGGRRIRKGKELKRGLALTEQLDGQ